MNNELEPSIVIYPNSSNIYVDISNDDSIRSDDEKGKISNKIIWNNFSTLHVELMLRKLFIDDDMTSL